MASFGTLPDGRSVDIHELKSDLLSVRITNYGGRIISVCKDGIDMTCGPKTFDAMLRDTCYCGAICGRVANRIEKGKFSLDGNSHQLAVNNAPNHLHGGLEGFDSKIWDIQEATDKKLVLTLHSSDGEENYPGNLEIVATYRLEETTLELKLEAYTTDIPTIVNLTNHVYWNLNGNGTIDNHTLEVRATAYTPKDDTGIPDGRILPVVHTPFDLRKPGLLGECNSPANPEIAGGYDHNYVLPSEGGEQVAAILRCPASGRKMVIATDAPGLQVYTGDYLPQPRHGIALEAQGFPNAINIPHFPSIVLRPGQSALRTITWTLV
ncbi:aldose epimerase family protein [Akkermansia sp. N21116]|jgi:aldose 1-epimerase|uniref:aldose epimerase family protein n=1 Tax=Akkermansia sp. N21116 TaxID=3040764 RepID=UPI00244F023F|nr:aldose epimerase family protein [Akkermansia sp. N21116]WPX41088.1 aldose epimerase family protein [Akkermansia sp. N21116]